MKVVVQRVLNSSVVIDDKYEEKINKGLMILLGMTYNDGIEDIDYLVNKILNLRIFEKDNKMNLSVKDINGDILLIPQFTLYANPYDGNRPSFNDALDKEEAEELFCIFKEKISSIYNSVKFGKFGSDMKVSLINDGPITIIIESKEKVKKWKE